MPNYDLLSILKDHNKNGTCSAVERNFDKLADPTKNLLRLFVHHNKNTKVYTDSWEINPDSLEGFEQEGERISVQKGNFSISIVFYDESPRLEVWKVGEDGELEYEFANIPIPVPSK